MSEHVIIWEHDVDTVTARVACLEEPGADCRLRGECECESWGPIERREDGTIWHQLTDGYRDLDLPRDVPQWHEVKPWDGCNIALFLNEDASVIAESSQERTAFEIARTPIDPVWNGDWYEWKRAEVTP